MPLSLIDYLYIYLSRRIHLLSSFSLFPPFVCCFTVLISYLYFYFSDQANFTTVSAAFKLSIQCPTSCPHPLCRRRRTPSNLCRPVRDAEEAGATARVATAPTAARAVPPAKALKRRRRRRRRGADHGVGRRTRRRRRRRRMGSGARGPEAGRRRERRDRRRKSTNARHTAK